VGALLRLEVWVESRDGPRKIWAGARLIDPLTNRVHCTGRGLSILSQPDDTDNALGAATGSDTMTGTEVLV
jgi:hypothetical protein